MLSRGRSNTKCRDVILSVTCCRWRDKARHKAAMKEVCNAITLHDSGRPNE